MSSSDIPDADDSLTAAERRLGVRHLACFPAYLQRDDGTSRVSMIRDLSATGAQLLVRAEVKVGDLVRLKLFIHGDINEAREVSGRLVRVEKLDDPFAGPWSLRVAVQFDDELSDMLPEITALAQRQASSPPGPPDPPTATPGPAKAD